MTVSELITLLEDQDPDAEVRLMTQPAWPFEYTVCGVCAAPELPDFAPSQPSEDRDIVYLVEGDQLGYGSQAAWEVCRRCELAYGAARLALGDF